MDRFLLFLIAAAVVAAPTETASPESLRAAQGRYLELFNRRDAQALALLLHPDYSELSPSADAPELWGQRSLTERRAVLQRRFDEYQTLQLELPSTQYAVVARSGVVTAAEKLTQKPRVGVLEYSRTRATYHWIFDEGRWQLLSVHRSARPNSAPAAVPLPQDGSEERILKTLFALPRWAGVPMADGRLLRLLAEATQARAVVEVGTSTGFASLWIADALRKTGGRLTTFEIDAGRAATARRQFQLAGVESFVTLIEGDAHQRVGQLRGPIDLLFLDADKDGYLDYLRQLLPLVRPGGLIVSHNMRFPAPNAQFVQAITTDPNLETIFLNMDDQGAGVTLKKR